ncbi:MAG TPA: class I SAM-dependent methyltransferase [Pseudonocardiaceae bacterium]|jgi:SAM-dependent methyltransferase
MTETDLLAKRWEQNYHPMTTGIIENLPIRSDWRCLDVGAGAGAMAYWLAEKAHRGSVLAVDIDTRHLDAGQADNLTVRQMDVSTEDFAPGSFDLVLARAVCSLVPDPDHLLARAARWVAPGGWLVAEDFYFLPGEDAPTPAARAVIASYLNGFAQAGADVRWARGLPANLAKAGLTSVGLHVTALGPGQSDQENELMRMRMGLQGQALADSGLVSSQQITEFVDSLDRPEARDVATLEFSAWGQRPTG